MKKLFIVIIVLLISFTGKATTYQIVNQVTFNAFNFSSLIDGDSILFAKGQSFYGTLNISTSGTSGNKIVIGAYGTGANPIITGFTTISGWTNEGGGIYSKVITSDSQTNMVTIDGVNTPMGRYPNSTYLTYESFNTNVSITDNELSVTPNWTGAEVAVRTTDFAIDRGIITNHSGSTLTYTNLGAGRNGQSNYGYFIQNDLRTLDSYGEWYHNTATGKFYMYFGAIDPTTKLVKVATKNNVIFHYNGSGSSPDYIVYDNLQIEGSILSAIYMENGSTYNTIQNCVINNSGKNGIQLKYYCTNNLINGNVFNDCTSSAIYCPNTSINLTITNNTISRTGLILGSDKGQEGYYTAISTGSDNTLIQYNSIDNSGYNGVAFGGNNIQIKNNFITNSCVNFNDGAGIYTADTHTSVIIDGNIVLNTIGTNNGTPQSFIIAEGIYLDEYANGITIQNNTIANCSSSGIKLHKAHDNIISNNILYSNGVGIYLFNSVTETTMENNAINGNICIAKEIIQYPLFFESRLNNDISFGTANNNYYARPLDDNATIRTDNVASVNRTLAQWQVFSGQDANSKKSPQAITSETDLQFEYNATSSPKTVTLSQPMIDVKGIRYLNFITLQPYTSIVLMKDYFTYGINKPFASGIHEWRF